MPVTPSDLQAEMMLSLQEQGATTSIKMNLERAGYAMCASC